MPASLLDPAGGFILSASLDKNVRLWHLSQPGCLRQFWHTDFVTSVQFHPLDAQRFVSGEVPGATALQQAVVSSSSNYQIKP
jgi:WD40 repeat protein